MTLGMPRMSIGIALALLVFGVVATGQEKSAERGNGRKFTRQIPTALASALERPSW